MIAVVVSAGLFIFVCFTASITVALLERREKRKGEKK